MQIIIILTKYLCVFMPLYFYAILMLAFNRYLEFACTYRIVIFNDNCRFAFL